MRSEAERGERRIEDVQDLQQLGHRVHRDPDENNVISANEIALKPRVFSSKRSRRYSGTERAREP